MEPKALVLAICNSLLSVFGSTMNSVVVIVIFKNQNLQKGLNLLILSLAVADFMNCAISQPMYVFAVLNYKHQTSIFQQAFTVVAFITLHASTTNLVAITLHRVKALSRPFTHLLLVSKKQVFIVVTLIWLLSISVGVFFSTESGKVVAAYFHLAVTITWIGGYIGLFWLVRQHKRKIVAFESSPTSKIQTASLEYESEAAKTSAILVGSSLLCFFPDIVFDFMGRADQSRMAWGFTLLFFSSCLNPCLFIWRSHQFRTILGKTWRDFWQGQK